MASNVESTSYLRVEDLRKLAECSLCLDVLETPRTLQCQHVFCQRCIEEHIMQFREDGSCVINCPLKCKVPTFLKTAETVNDLPVAYMVKGMLDMLNATQSVNSASLCTAKADCRKHVSMCCCGKLMCEGCFNSHLCQGTDATQGGSPVAFDKRDNLFHLSCRVHHADCSYICSDGDFLCLYCLQRDHKGHDMRRIGDKVAALKDTVVRWGMLENAKNVELSFRMTSDAVAVSQQTLNDLLDLRIEECCLRYRDWLSGEVKEKIQTEFLELCNSHLEQYAASARVSQLSKYIMKKPDVVLATEMIAILEQIKREVISVFSCADIAITSEHGFMESQPLGRLERGYRLAPIDKPVVTLTENFSALLPKKIAMNTIQDSSQDLVTVQMPSFEEQKNMIRDAMRAALVLGDEWYLIGIDWFKQWKKYIEFACNGHHPEHYPGPVDNSPLFQTGGTKLKEHLLENTYYKLINKAGWNNCVSWYGVKSELSVIKRCVVEQGIYNKQLRVEVYLTELKLSTFMNLDRIIVKEFSKATKVTNVVEDMKRLLGLPGDEEVRLWNKFGTKHYELISNLEQSLHDSGIGFGQHLILEQKTEEGKWPRSRNERKRAGGPSNY